MLALIDLEYERNRIARVDLARPWRRVGGQRAGDDRSCGRGCCSEQKISPALTRTSIDIGHWNSPGPLSPSRRSHWLIAEMRGGSVANRSLQHTPFPETGTLAQFSWRFSRA